MEDFDFESVFAQCKGVKACQEYQYDYQVSQSAWPQESYVLAFYCDAIRRPTCFDTMNGSFSTPLGKPFEVYEKILNLSKTNETMAWQEQLKLDLITRNFIDLKITFDVSIKTNILQYYYCNYFLLWLSNKPLFRQFLLKSYGSCLMDAS